MWGTVWKDFRPTERSELATSRLRAKCFADRVTQGRGFGPCKSELIRAAHEQARAFCSLSRRAASFCGACRKRKRIFGRWCSSDALFFFPGSPIVHSALNHSVSTIELITLSLDLLQVQRLSPILFQVLGTPTEATWEGVSRLKNYKLRECGLGGFCGGAARGACRCRQVRRVPGPAPAHGVP